jgi:hypothetical protein
MYYGMLQFTQTIMLWHKSFQEAAEFAAAIQREETRMERYHESIILIYAPADATIGYVQKFGVVVGMVSKNGEVRRYLPVTHTVVSLPCPGECPFHK